MPVFAAVAAFVLVPDAPALAVSFTVIGGTDHALPANARLSARTGPASRVLNR